MKPPYRLRGVRLLNWHNFIDETLEVDGSLFLIGDNGSGKTTLLDAIHCALTGDWKVELNAAARIAGRRGEGRDLAGIVLRHDVERGYQREGGAVAYSALELARAAGSGRSPERLTIGIGLYVAAPDARPEKWGFVVPRPLADVPLVVDAGDGRRRPADRRELAEALGPGAVLDVGRYRTAVGERLFGSREHLAEVASFLSAGKAYRELVTRTQNFSELFAGLLREPEVETYHEARRALDAIERLRADREALGTELERLRALIDWRERVTEERRAVGRHDFLIAHHAAADARERVAGLEREAAAAREAEARARAEHSAASSRAKSLEEERDRLRASRGMELLERAREVELRAREAGERAAERRTERDGAAETLAAAESEHAALVEELATAARAARDALARVSGTGARALPGDALGTLARLERRTVVLEESPATETFDARDASAEERAIARALRDAEQSLRDEARALAREADEARAEEEAAAAELEVLRARGSVAPPLAGLDDALGLLRAAGIAAAPLYELVEPRRGTSPEELGWIERALGPRLLCSVVVPREEHVRARELVLQRAPGVPLVDLRDHDQAVLFGNGPEERVLDRLRVDASHPAARALLEHHAGVLAWIAEAGEGEVDEEYLDAGGRLHAGHLDERLHDGPARWIGARARERALEEAAEALETRARDAGRRAIDAARRARELEARIAAAREAQDALDALDLGELDRLVVRRDRLADRAGESRARLARLESELTDARARAEELGRTLEALRRSLAEEGLEALAGRLTAVEGELRDVRSRLDDASRAVGEATASLRVAEASLSGARSALEETESALAAARGKLLALAPEEALGDLEDWVFRTKRGAQIRRENLATNREDALRREERWVSQIEGSDGVRHPALWQKYAFDYDRATNRLADSAGRDVEQDAGDLQNQLDQVDEALDARGQDLLERVVLEELAGALRRDAHELRGTIREVNALIEDLEFGRNRYRIEARLRGDFKRLLALLDKSSALSPAAREELKGFFEARLDDFRGAGDDELPPFLDYRRWYEFRMQVSTAGSAGVELTRERRAQGSGGEQAVPNYLLLFCLTTLLYQGIDARVRLLLLDEAFYGIDAGRRDELLRFCERAGVDLVVATPEMDGVTEALASSTTLLVEKTAQNDVYLWDARFRRRSGELFEEEQTPPEELTIGRSGPDA